MSPNHAETTLYVLYTLGVYEAASDRARELESSLPSSHTWIENDEFARLTNSAYGHMYALIRVHTFGYLLGLPHQAGPQCCIFSRLCAKSTRHSYRLAMHELLQCLRLTLGSPFGCYK
ncbi:hypothetical protein TWF569_006281 [Orbilia oligospora]|nr:hypothetical protein TWF569_006281 [Orbilia oligospora]